MVGEARGAADDARYRFAEMMPVAEMMPDNVDRRLRCRDRAVRGVRLSRCAVVRDDASIAMVCTQNRLVDSNGGWFQPPASSRTSLLVDLLDT